MLFRYWQNHKACWLEILLAEPQKTFWGLCKRLWHLFKFENNKTQALHWHSTIAHTNPPIEKPFDRPYNRITNINQLKAKSYDPILFIVDQLTKMMHYKLVKVTINVARLAKIILAMVVWHHGLFNLIVTDRGLLFTLKFQLSLCYFFDMK